MPRVDERKKVARLRVVITIAALLLALGHVLVPTVKLDTTTLVLIGFAMLPWVAPLVRSVELPGGFKVEMRDLREAERKADEAGLLADESSRTTQYVFSEIADRDPNLALAGLRIEIERRLKQLGESRGLDVYRASIGKLLDMLTEVDVLRPQQAGVLRDLAHLLNEGAHGAVVDADATRWAMDVGPRLLASLDQLLAPAGA